jgi:phosphoserine phosphatase
MYEGELIIVTQLISQAPIYQKNRDIKIEKIIVDLYTKDLITEFINEDEKNDVIENIFKSYPVNMKTVYAYAKRRNNLDIIKTALSSYESGGLS